MRVKTNLAWCWIFTNLLLHIYNHTEAERKPFLVRFCSTGRKRACYIYGVFLLGVLNKRKLVHLLTKKQKGFSEKNLAPLFDHSPD